MTKKYMTQESYLLETTEPINEANNEVLVIKLKDHENAIQEAILSEINKTIKMLKDMKWGPIYLTVFGAKHDQLIDDIIKKLEEIKMKIFDSKKNK